MKNKTRWIFSVLTGVLALPASYAAGVLICGAGPVPVGRLLVLANALTLIP